MYALERRLGAPRLVIDMPFCTGVGKGCRLTGRESATRHRQSNIGLDRTYHHGISLLARLGKHVSMRQVAMAALYDVVAALP